MFDKWRKYSYAAQKERRHRLIKTILWVISFFLIFSLVSSLFISTVVVENRTMLPGINPGDRFFVSPFPYGARIPFTAARLPGPSSPRRGDLVLVERRPADYGGFHKLSESAIRFFSGQRASLPGADSPIRSVKRVIGIPGDVIGMEQYVLRVKPAGDSYDLTEFELAKRPYDVVVPQIPTGWDRSFPFSGSMEAITLGEDEYFLVSDDRSSAFDSRTWGPVSSDALSAKVLFRYWPFSRIGRP